MVDKPTILKEPAAEYMPVMDVDFETVVPTIDQIVTEDDTPVDNIFSAKQQRLLVEPLYSSWQPDRSFLADTNIGIFHLARRPPIVPDMFLSLDVEVAENWYEKKHRSYFMWELGKSPDVVIEIVANREGQESGFKLREYNRIMVQYYAIFDPLRLIQKDVLRVFGLQEGVYVLQKGFSLKNIGLNLTLWDGCFEEKQATWVRWCDDKGQLIPTGKERADEQTLRAERLAAQLKAAGIEPEN